MKTKILGKLGHYIILTENNCLTLKTNDYPNGGKFLITATKRTENGFSCQLKDLQTNKPVMDNTWINADAIDKMKIK